MRKVRRFLVNKVQSTVAAERVANCLPVPQIAGGLDTEIDASLGRETVGSCSYRENLHFFLDIPSLVCSLQAGGIVGKCDTFWG